MANLGAQAGSGFDASDLTTGTLGNTVQDNITRLGTVTSGTFNGTIGGSATFPQTGYAQLDLSAHASQVEITWSTITGDTTNITELSSRCQFL